MIDDRDDSELQAVSSYAQSIQTGAFADYRVGLLHGKMKPAEKDAIMQAFRAHEIDLLVSTTVIEVGVDVPNATILLIETPSGSGCPSSTSCGDVWDVAVHRAIASS